MQLLEDKVFGGLSGSSRLWKLEKCRHTAHTVGCCAFCIDNIEASVGKNSSVDIKVDLSTAMK